jgi:hypothetical protein
MLIYLGQRDEPHDVAVLFVDDFQDGVIKELLYVTSLPEFLVRVDD